jgi:hypothetical protein
MLAIVIVAAVLCIGAHALNPGDNYADGEWRKVGDLFDGCIPTIP